MGGEVERNEEAKWYSQFHPFFSAILNVKLSTDKTSHIHHLGDLLYEIKCGFKDVWHFPLNKVFIHVIFFIVGDTIWRHWSRWFSLYLSSAYQGDNALGSVHLLISILPTDCVFLSPNCHYRSYIFVYVSVIRGQVKKISHAKFLQAKKCFVYLRMQSWPFA